MLQPNLYTVFAAIQQNNSNHIVCVQWRYICDINVLPTNHNEYTTIYHQVYAISHPWHDSIVIYNFVDEPSIYVFSCDACTTRKCGFLPSRTWADLTLFFHTIAYNRVNENYYFFFISWWWMREIPSEQLHSSVFLIIATIDSEAHRLIVD